MAGRIQISSIVLSVLMLGSFAGGCATTPSAENDPYESFNHRQMFALNEKLDRIVAEPAAKAYTLVVLPNQRRRTACTTRSQI